MTIERSVRLLAGVLILTGLALAYFVSPWWALLYAFVGLNLTVGLHRVLPGRSGASLRISTSPSSATTWGKPSASKNWRP